MKTISTWTADSKCHRTSTVAKPGWRRPTCHALQLWWKWLCALVLMADTCFSVFSLPDLSLGRRSSRIAHTPGPLQPFRPVWVFWPVEWSSFQVPQAWGVGTWPPTEKPPAPWTITSTSTLAIRAQVPSVWPQLQFSLKDLLLGKKKKKKSKTKNTISC